MNGAFLVLLSEEVQLLCDLLGSFSTVLIAGPARVRIDAHAHVHAHVTGAAFLGHRRLFRTSTEGVSVVDARSI